MNIKDGSATPKFINKYTAGREICDINKLFKGQSINSSFSVIRIIHKYGITFS